MIVSVACQSPPLCQRTPQKAEKNIYEPYMTPITTKTRYMYHQMGTQMHIAFINRMSTYTTWNSMSISKWTPTFSFSEHRRPLYKWCQCPPVGRWQPILIGCQLPLNRKTSTRFESGVVFQFNWKSASDFIWTLKSKSSRFWKPASHLFWTPSSKFSKNLEVRVQFKLPLTSNFGL